MFLHRLRAYEVNRVTEEVRTEDTAGDRPTLFLQRVFQLIYGWQDRLVLRIDLWCSNKAMKEDA